MDADAFVRAAGAGDLAAVQRYVQQGGDVNYATSKGWTALNSALQSAVSPDSPGDPKGVARFLVDGGADLSVPSPDGWRPLVKAAAWSASMADVLEYLLTHGDAWLGPQDWKGINYAASWRGDTGIRLLCAHGADPNCRDDKGGSPLMRAAKKGHKATIEALLEFGADPDLKDLEGVTALMIAAKKPMVDNVALLLDHGATPRLKDKKGRSALDHARAAKRAKVVALLESRDS